MIDSKPGAGDVLDDPLQMKEAFPGVLKTGAGFERRSQFLVVLRAPIGQASGVAEDVPRCNPVSPLSAQSILLQILVKWTIEVNRALLRQLQHDAGKDRFAERRCGKERVRSDRCFRGRIGDAEVVLPNRLAGTDESHAETRQGGQIQEMR
jgi:hypothetical protein